MPKGVYERKTEEQRFWEKVVIKEPEECWLWTASIDTDGYGWFSFKSTTETQKSKTVMAHRYSAILKYGDVSGALVRHTCDTRACVIPNHLLLGSHADNSADMVERNRQLKGELHHSATLNEAQAIEILKKYQADKQSGRLYGSLERLAREFGVDKQVISRLTAGKTWKHLPR